MAAIDPDFQLFLEGQERALAEQPMPPLDQLPAEMVRAGYRMQRTSQDTRAPKNVEARDFTIPGPAGAIPVRLYTPPGASASSGGLVYFHGGGWVIGDLDTHDGHCRRLASYAGVRVLAVDYRLAPEHPFPAGHDDALAATEWAFDHAQEIGVDPRRIAVGGCSAGGNLAASVALDLRHDPKRRPAFQLLLYPVTWPEQETATRRERALGPLLTKEAMDWFERHLGAHAHAAGHRAMPARAKELAGAPPALVVTAGHDMLEEEGRDYAAALEAAGVAAEHLNYPTLVHDFFVMGDVSPAVDAAARETAERLRAALR
jgi:acetyl esterase